MVFFRQYIIPLLVMLVFFVALLAVSARIFLPSDMRAPAPIEDADSAAGQKSVPKTLAEQPQVETPTLQTSAGKAVQ